MARKSQQATPQRSASTNVKPAPAIPAPADGSETRTAGVLGREPSSGPRRSRRLSGLQPEIAADAAPSIEKQDLQRHNNAAYACGKRQQQQGISTAPVQQRASKAAPDQSVLQQQQPQRRRSEPLMDLEDAGLKLDRCAPFLQTGQLTIHTLPVQQSTVSLLVLVDVKRTRRLFKSALSGGRLSLYRRRGLAVTDVTAAEWCQQQLAYTLSAKIKKVLRSPCQLVCTPSIIISLYHHLISSSSHFALRTAASMLS